MRGGHFDKFVSIKYIDTGVRFWEIDNFVSIEIPGPGNNYPRTNFFKILIPLGVGFQIFKFDF